MWEWPLVLFYTKWCEINRWLLKELEELYGKGKHFKKTGEYSRLSRSF